jgi:hypothetical protein
LGTLPRIWANKEIKKMENKINSIAYELFRHWTKQASFDYPDLDFTIIDERTLVKDVEEALESALNSLIKTEKAQKRLMPGYDYSFVLGFIQGKINTHWGFEYITKRSKEFKNLMINKALLEYLEYDTVTAIKLKTIYERMYQDTVNLESLDYELPKEKIADYGIEQLHDNDFSGEEHNPLIVFLRNQISEQIFHLLKIKTKDYLPDLDIFFSNDHVIKLIHNKEN